MNKTEQVSIGRRGFVCDQNAYKILQDYLKRAEKVLADDPDKKEILNDLEHSMAGHLIELSGKLVVDEETAEKVVELMGEVQLDTDNVSSGEDKQDKTLKNAWKNAPLKDHDGEVVNGVCSGIAKHFDVDPLWIRIGFVVFTVLTGGFGILVYLVLAFIMKDEPGYQKKNANEIVEDVKEKVNDVVHVRPRYERALKSIFTGSWKFIVWATRLALLAVLLCVAIAWSTFLFFMITNPNKIVLFGASPSALDFIAIVSSGLVIILPLFSLIAVLVGSNFVKNVRFNLITWCVWVLALITTAGALVNVAPNVRNRLIKEQPKTDVVLVEVEEGQIVHSCFSLFGTCNTPAPNIYEKELCGTKVRMIDFDDNFNRIQNRSWEYNSTALSYPASPESYCDYVKSRIDYNGKGHIVFLNQTINDSPTEITEYVGASYGDFADQVQQEYRTKKVWQAVDFTRHVYP